MLYTTINVSIPMHFWGVLNVWAFWSYCIVKRSDRIKSTLHLEQSNEHHCLENVFCGSYWGLWSIWSLYLGRVVDKGLILFFKIWTLSCASITAKDTVFSNVYFWHLCQYHMVVTTFTPVWVFCVFQWFTHLFLCQFHDYFTIIILYYSLKSCMVIIPAMTFCSKLLFFDYLGAFVVYMNFRIIFFYLYGKCLVLFIRSALNLQVVFGIITIFAIWFLLSMSMRLFPSTNVFLSLLVQIFKVFIVETFYLPDFMYS